MAPRTPMMPIVNIISRRLNPLSGSARDLGTVGHRPHGHLDESCEGGEGIMGTPGAGVHGL
jgi:hypothetical protein